MPNKWSYYLQLAGAAAVAIGLGILLWRREVAPFMTIGAGMLLFWLGWFVRDRGWL